MKNLLLSVRLYLLRAYNKLMVAGRPPVLPAKPLDEPAGHEPPLISLDVLWVIVLVAGIVVLLPFHAVFTTWAGSTFGHLDLFRIWKELLCIPLVLLCVWQLAYKPELRRQVLGSPIFWLGLGYCLFMALIGVVALWQGAVTSSALIFALLANGRIIVFLVAAWVVGLQNQWLHKHWQQLVIAPALLVISFGILQRLVLPADVLRHVGYGASTIPAVQTVDEQVDYRRVQSTLRGANPLGAYLVLIITALVADVLRRKQGRDIGTFLVASAAGVLLVTYSRSAYLGALVSVGLLLWWLLPAQRWRRTMVAGACAAVLVFGLGVVVLRNNDAVQNVVFHSSEKSQAPISSNTGRTYALRQGLEDALYHPLGRGPGTAGPASFRNTGQPPRIAENYYIQLAQEVGWLGLGLFVAFSVVVARELWQRRKDTLSLVLLASLAGLTVVNLLSHAWMDDTLGMLWWGLAGIAISAAPATIESNTNKQRKHRGTSKTETKSKPKQARTPTHR
jgi:hypothetical protein